MLEQSNKFRRISFVTLECIRSFLFEILLKEISIVIFNYSNCGQVNNVGDVTPMLSAYN